MTAPLTSAGRARALACLLALSGARAALAQSPPEDPQETDTPAADTAATAPPAELIETPWKTRFGARLVAGAPEGVGLAVLIHPRRWLRASAGAARDTLGWQARAGVDLIPLDLTVAPVLTLEYGHGFRADYGKLLDELHGRSAPAATDIRQVDYDQIGACLGLEFSPWRSVTFFGGAGLSYWFAGVRDVTTFIREAVDSPHVTSTPLLLGLSTPMARLGLIISFD